MTDKTPSGSIARIITQTVDFFYIKPLRFIPLHTFRYAAIGGVNLLFSIVLYWFCYNFILHQQDVNLGIVVISAPIFSMLITFVITLLTGFWLNHNVVFTGSHLRSRTQLFRYSQVVIVNLLINYFGLKLLINIWEFFPSIAYATIQIINIAFSYTMQRFYTFRGHK